MIVSGGTPARADGGHDLAVTSTGLTEGQLVGEQTVLHPVLTGDDITKIELVVNGMLRHTYTTVPTGVVLQFSSLITYPDPVPVTIRLTGAAGETAEATTDVHVDNVDPRATFGPADGATVHGSTVTVTPVTISDDVAEIALIGGPDSHVIAAATEAPWSVTAPLSGTYALLVLRLTDRVGNRFYYELHYQVDNAGPRVGFVWPSYYVPGAVPGGRNTGFGASVTDPAGVDRVEWWSGDTPIASIDTYDFGTASRTIPFEVRAWDRFGNESIHPVSVRVDTAGPAIASITPAAGALLRGTYLHSTIKATDPSGIGWINLNGFSMDQANSVVSLGADGSHVWTWDIYDGFGNRTTVKRTVIVDNTKPSLRVTKAPKSGSKVSGTFQVTASASDRNRVDRVELLVNGKVVAKDTTSGYSFSINPKKYGQTFKVQLRAYDRAGNSTTSSTYTWHR